MTIEEQEYDFVNQQVKYNNEKIFQALELFIKLMIVVIGGMFWLITQKLDNHFLQQLINPIRLLFVLVGVGSGSLIILHTISWWCYRKAQVKLNDNVQPPRWRSLCREMSMIIIICVMVFCACRYTSAIFSYK